MNVFLKQDVIVSVLIFVYNQRDLVRRTVESVLKQKFNGILEVIIHDDCSTDGTVDVLNEISREYPQIKLVLQNFNHVGSGLAIEAFNRVTAIATGEFFALCDGDDFWHDEFKLKKQLVLFTNGVGLVYTDCNFMKKETFITEVFASGYLPRYFNSEDFIIKGGFLAPSSWIWRREVLSSLPCNRLINIDISFYIMTSAFLKGGVEYCSDSTTTISVNDNSFSRSKDLLRIVDRTERLFELKMFLNTELNSSVELKLREDLFFSLFPLILLLEPNRINLFVKENRPSPKWAWCFRLRGFIWISSLCPLFFRWIFVIFYRQNGYTW
jgi:glucosyltransferase